MSGVSRRRFAAATAAISVSVVTLLFLLTVGRCKTTFSIFPVTVFFSDFLI